MNPGPDAAQWYANEVAVISLVVTGIGVFVNALIAYYAVTQTRAARASAEAAKESVRVAQESVELARSSLEQAIVPCVLLVHDSSIPKGEQIKHYLLINVGNGPALNVRATVPKWKDFVDSPALAPKESMVVKIDLDDLQEFGPFICIFESLSAVTYKTESALMKDKLITTEFRHEFQKVTASEGLT